MANRVLTGPAVGQRYQTYVGNQLILRVTRQDQQFIIGADYQHVDLELVKSSVQLVGEPGFGACGAVYDGNGVAYNGSTAAVYTAGHQNTINYLHAVNDPDFASMAAGFKYRMYGQVVPNHIVTRPDLDHGWVTVSIDGMTEHRHFQTDRQKVDNQIQLLLPTDLGLLQTRNILNASHRPLCLENTNLKQRLTVSTHFVGTRAEPLLKARFVEDWADQTGNRDSEGKAVYFADGEAQGTTNECQIPSNMVESMILIFSVKPRSTV